MTSRLRVTAAALLAFLTIASVPAANRTAAPAEAPAPATLSSAAERVYELAKPRILQIRTLLQGTGRQSSLGSGFLVTADGLAITNYHVASQFALDPKTYRLEYLAPDGSKGPITDHRPSALLARACYLGFPGTCNRASQ